MQPFAFCNRCRGMKVGWNRRYILHCLIVWNGFLSRPRLLVLTVSFVFICLCVSRVHRPGCDPRMPAEQLPSPTVDEAATLSEISSMAAVHREDARAATASIKTHRPRSPARS